MKPKLSELEALARGAGEILRAGYHQENPVNHKGRIDLVTEVDRQSEAYLLDAIAEQFPAHRVVAEETGGLEGSEEFIWYIDPLDGTTNFAHKLPIFSVSIAFADAVGLSLGVVYDPMRDEMFTAERGRGVWMNGDAVKVGAATELSNSLLVTGFPYDRFENPENNLEYFNRFALQVQGIRRLGSAAMDLCYVACGRVDGFWEVRLEPWDLAAGTLIGREAGATVTKLNGELDMLTAPYNVVAANPNLHGLMLGVLRNED